MTVRNFRKLHRLFVLDGWRDRRLRIRLLFIIGSLAYSIFIIRIRCFLALVLIIVRIIVIKCAAFGIITLIRVILLVTRAFEIEKERLYCFLCFLDLCSE
jgi:hypothetical protein